MAVSAVSPRARVLRLLKRHGHNTTSFQILEPGLEYWFDDTGDACVAYADTGGAWVVAGAPIAAHERESEVAAHFMEFARARKKRVRFFAVERECIVDAGLTLLHLGEQPVWDPTRWPESLRKKRSLREQLRRARAKGVIIRQVDRNELLDPQGPVRQGVDALIARWKDSREMAPMGFVVQIDLYTYPDERRIFVAERHGRVVGVLAAVPIYAREGWFFEDVLRHPGAPNGTIELLFDHAMRAAAEAGIEHVTYGLAPLSGTPSRLMGFIRDHTRWLYDFEGVRAFKAKLMPDGWHPVYLGYPSGNTGSRAVIDALAAFARGSFVRFGLATLRHRASAVTRILALLLIPWTLAMALSDTARWFPSTAIKLGWIGLDIALFILLMQLAAAWRKSLAMTLCGLALGDFALGCVQAVLYDLPMTRGVTAIFDMTVIGLALAAPLFAAIFLWLCRDRARLYLTPALRQTHVAPGRALPEHFRAN